MKASGLKILVTASTYPRWQDDGVPMFVYDQLDFLKKKFPDIDLTLLVPHHLGAKKIEDTEFGKTHRFQYMYPARYQQLVYPAIMPNLKENKWLYFQIPFLILFEFFALLMLVIKTKPDYIYSHWFMPQGIVGGLVGMLTGTKHVYTSHSSDVMIAARIPLLGPFLVRFITKQAEKVTVVSQRSLAKLKYFFSVDGWAKVKDKVKIIPMGVDTASFGVAKASTSELKEKYGYEGRNILFFIGRLSEKKGIKYILEALKTYKEIDPSVLLVIAGDGPLMAPLKSMAVDSQLVDFVDFVGFTGGDKKLELFKMCDVLLLPSIITADGDAEGCPVVLMEGLASGKICVATTVSGADDVLKSGVDGFLIQPMMANDVLDALKTINGLTKDERAAISKNAIRKSKDFDWDSIVTRQAQHLFE